MDYPGLLELLKKRRSCHSFRPDPVPDDCIDKIIEAARWAPSGANSQPWEFVVVKSKDVKDKIVRLCEEHTTESRLMELTRAPELRNPPVANPPANPEYADAPVFIILFGDRRTNEAYAKTALCHFGEIHYISSLASAFLYMHLAASSLGLGSQWVSRSAFPGTQCLIKDMLGIPGQLELYEMIAIGYAARQPQQRLVRETAEMVHYDHFDKAKFRTNEDIRDFIISLRKQSLNTR